MQTFNPSYSSIIDDLSKNGFAICEGFLPFETVSVLSALALKLQESGELREAKTGLSSQTSSIKWRGDSIAWLDENSPEPAVQSYFSKMSVLREAINMNLFLNVQEIESHLAVFPAGSVYSKHLDQFQQGAGTQARQLSSIVYLNHDWPADAGGALRLYLNQSQPDTTDFIDIAPTAGKLVLFLSHDFWHEVLPAKRQRMSIAGWFRTRN